MVELDLAGIVAALAEADVVHEYQGFAECIFCEASIPWPWGQLDLLAAESWHKQDCLWLRARQARRP